MAEVDDLRPEDRIKKLKEKQAEMKKAIAEAQKKIAESETELNAENLIKEKIPIPQLKADSMSELSEAEKEIFKTINDSQAALQKMYNNMANMSDLIVTKLKRK